MKGLVYIWSQLNLVPVLTPFVILPTLWILRRLLQGALERVNAALVTFIILAATSAGTYWMFERSPVEYEKFLVERGVETEAKVLAISHGDSFLMGGAYDEVEIEFHDPEATPLKASYVSLPRRFFPLIEAPFELPTINDKIPIRYFPTVETGFIILIDAKKSNYGAKLECNELRSQVAKAELRFRHDDFPTRSDTEALGAAIDALLPLDCIDLKERDRLRELKPKLK